MEEKKKEYTSPKAEKVEFDYTETVSASVNNCGGKKGYNDDPNGQYYKCLSTDYYGC